MARKLDIIETLHLNELIQCSPQIQLCLAATRNSLLNLLTHLHREKLFLVFLTAQSDETRDLASVTNKNFNQGTNKVTPFNDHNKGTHSLKNQNNSREDLSNETSFTVQNQYSKPNLRNNVQYSSNELRPTDSETFKRIPASKFTISQSAVKIFNKPKALAEEIIKHKKLQENTTKILKLTHQKGNLIWKYSSNRHRRH